MLSGGSLEGDLQIPEAGAGWAVLQRGLNTPAARVSVNARGLLDCCLGEGWEWPPSPVGWLKIQESCIPPTSILDRLLAVVWRGTAKALVLGGSFCSGREVAKPAARSM